VYVYGAKRFAQFNGQGGADNYLAWRLAEAASEGGAKSPRRDVTRGSTNK
jgi:hypothetical protein